MADIFIKNASGEIWKNSEGAILKAKKFNEMPIQQGLTFWGAADPRYLTLVDGLVSEAYDVRGTGAKMAQVTIANRPSLYSNSIRFTGNHKLTITTTALNGFIVFKSVANTGNNIGLGGARLSYLGERQDRPGFINVGAILDYYYGNNVKFNTFMPQNNNLQILHTINGNLIVNNNTMILGTLYNETVPDVQIVEWGWYNRVLAELEVIYNINALNAKYQIF